MFVAPQTNAEFHWGVTINTSPRAAEYERVFVQYFDYRGCPVYDQWGDPVGHYELVAVPRPSYGPVIRHESIRFYFKGGGHDDHRDRDWRDDRRRK